MTCGSCTICSSRAVSGECDGCRNNDKQQAGIEEMVASHRLVVQKLWA
jgi:hypothetical protein